MYVKLDQTKADNNLFDQPEGMYLVKKGNKDCSVQIVALRNNDLRGKAHSIVIDPKNSMLNKFALLADTEIWKVIRRIETITEGKTNIQI